MSKANNAAPRQPLLPYIVLGVLGPLSFTAILWPYIWWAHHIQFGRKILPFPISDFAMFWGSGHFAARLKPEQIYQTASLFTWKIRHVAGPHHTDPFVYLPPTLLLTRLIDFGSYWQAYLSWTIGLTTLSAAALRTARLPWSIILFTILTPASLYNILLGQLSLLTGCCFVGSLLLIDRAPIQSGIFSALTLFKPQIALLAPLAIMAQKSWRGVAAGLAVVGMLCLLTLAIFGSPLWVAYVTHGMRSSHKLLALPYPRPAFGPNYRGGYEYDQISVFYMLRSCGFTTTSAMIGQALSAFGAGVLCWRLWRRDDSDPIIRVVITIFLGVLVTPYGFIQDLSAFSLGVILLIWRRGTMETGDVVLLMWPGILGLMSAIFDKSFTPLLVIWAIYRAHAISRQRGTEVPIRAAAS
jgi:hypothetical protein